MDYFIGNGNIKVYLAGPWFNDEQFERLEYLRDRLKEDYLVFSPKDVNLFENNKGIDASAILKANTDAIDECDFIFVITDGKDVGTIFEAGYAHAIGKPIVYYAETLGNNKFNLMLGCSGVLVVRDRNSLDELIDSGDLVKYLHGELTYKFDGLME